MMRFRGVTNAVRLKLEYEDSVCNLATLGAYAAMQELGHPLKKDFTPYFEY
jgi:hypothetical protein